jgi:hypothetical protein
MFESTLDNVGLSRERLVTTLFQWAGTIKEVDDHAFEKRAKMIRKRFKLRPWMVQERNMLWFSPPLEEIQGQSLGMFGEWDPIRILCVDLLRHPAIQLCFFVINAISIIALAVRPAREAILYDYDAFGEPVQAPYYKIGNVYLIAELIAFLTLGFEIVLSVVARGLLEGHYAFIKDPFNVLDAVIFAVTFLEFILWAFGWTIILRGFRVLKFLKPLMLINLSEGCRAIVTSMRSSFEFVQVIAVIIVVLLLSFSAALPPVFGAHMKRRCVVERTDTQYVLDRFNNTQRVRQAHQSAGHGFGFCTVYKTRKSLLGWLTSEDSCPKQSNAAVAQVTAGAGLNQVCDPLIGAPDGGFGQVDTIWSSFTALFQASAGDGWHITPSRLGEAEPKWKTFAWIVFAVPSVGCALFLFPAFIALGARKYYECRLEQHMGKNNFLNVVGHAETHQHHAHHLQEQNSSVSESWGSSESESSQTERIGSAEHEFHEAENLRNTVANIKTSPLGSQSASPFAPAEHSPNHIQSSLKSPLKSPLRSYAKVDSPVRSVLKSPSKSASHKSPLGSPLRSGFMNSPLSQKTYATKASHRSAVTDFSEKSVIERVTTYIGKMLFEVSCVSAVILNNLMIILELQERSAHGESSDERASGFSVASTFFSFFFMVEIVIRIFLTGSLLKHLRMVRSVVDISIVFVDTAGLVAVAMGSSRWHVLRSVASIRLYRVMLLLPASGQVLRTAGNHFAFLASALAVPTIFMVGCSITAHHYFGEGLRFGDAQRFSYFTFIETFRVLMHVSSGDKWREIVYGSLQSASNVASASRINPNPQAIAYIGFFFIITVFYLFRFWFRGLFIGVVKECFSLDEIEHGALSQISRNLGPLWKTGAELQTVLSRKISEGDKAAGRLMSQIAKESYHFARKIYQRARRRLFPYLDLAKPIQGIVPTGQVDANLNRGHKNDEEIQPGDSPDYEIFGDTIDTVLGAPRRPPVLGHPECTALWVPIFGGLRYKNPIRIFCRIFLGSNLWKVLINLSVLLSSVFIFIGETNRAAVTDQRVLETGVDIAYEVFTGVFIAEFVMQVLAQGILFPPRSYLRDVENMFDFTLLVINLVDFGLSTSSAFLRAILILRLLRLFRPPRPYRTGEGMVYHSVMGALLWMAIITVFAGFVYSIFAIIGMEIFSGQLHSCTCAHIKFPAGRESCSGNGIFGRVDDAVYGDILLKVPFAGDGFLGPCAWSVSSSGHFDTFPDALVALVRISARKWSDLLQACISISGRGNEPIPAGRADIGLFFAVFIVVSTLFLENLIAAFMIQGFGRGLHFANVRYA